MSNDGRRTELRTRLREVEGSFDRQMRDRGFEPEQVENIALPGPLARLYAARAELRAELEELEAETLERENVMREIERIEDQLKRAFEGGAWHGPGVLEILKDVTAGQAAARPIPGAHSIWELVLHIAAWEGACRRRLEGDRAELTDDENWTPVEDTSEFAWQQAKTKLIESHRRLRLALGKTDDSRLNEPILPGMSSVYVTLHGAVQHDLYHAGQIAILKKATAEAETI